MSKIPERVKEWESGGSAPRKILIGLALQIVGKGGNSLLSSVIYSKTFGKDLQSENTRCTLKPLVVVLNLQRPLQESGKQQKGYQGFDYEGELTHW